MGAFSSSFQNMANLAKGGTLPRVLMGVGTLGLSELALQANQALEEENKRKLQEMGGVLTGSQIPEYALREMSPDRIDQTKASQLLSIGTPEAVAAANEFIETPKSRMEKERFGAEIGLIKARTAAANRTNTGGGGNLMDVIKAYPQMFSNLSKEEMAAMALGVNPGDIIMKKAARLQTAAVPGLDFADPSQIPTAEDAKTIKKALPAYQSIDKTLTDLENLFEKEGTANTFLSAQTSKRYDNLSGQLIADYKQMQQLGTLDKGVQELFDRIITTPNTLFSTGRGFKQQISQLKDGLKRDIRSKIQTRGYKLPAELQGEEVQQTGGRPVKDNLTGITIRRVK